MKKEVREITTDFINTVVTNNTFYLDGFQYENNLLQFFPTSKGYVKATSVEDWYAFNYVYQYKDHLGNIRMNYARDPKSGLLKILRENHYYPFGLTHKNYNSGKRNFVKEPDEELRIVVVDDKDFGYEYKYNGKEWQDELSLDWFDYGARNYDAAIGRWVNLDPMAEMSRRFSPYVYALNSPIYFIDPDGMQALSTFGVDEKGKVTKLDDQKYYNKNGKEVDRLVVTHKGERTSKSIDVTEGVLGKARTLNATRTVRGFEKKVEGQQISFGNNSSEALNVFNFLADNIIREFSLVVSGDAETPDKTNSTLYSTSSEDSETFGSENAKATAEIGKLKEYYHNHPYYDELEFSPADNQVQNEIKRLLDEHRKNQPNEATYEPTFFLRKKEEVIERKR